MSNNQAGYQWGEYRFCSEGCRDNFIEQLTGENAPSSDHRLEWYANLSNKENKCANHYECKNPLG